MLKKILITGIAGSLAIASAFYAIPAMAQNPSQGTPPPRGGRVEKHPVLRRAINQLDRIEGELAKADDDFQGHKEKARDLIHQAIEQLKRAIQSDKH